MAFHQLRLLASGPRVYGNFSLYSFPVFLPQCKSFPNSLKVCFKYSTFDTLGKYGGCSSHLRSVREGYVRRSATVQSKDLISKAGQDSSVKGIDGGYSLSDVRFQTPLSMRFPSTMKSSHICASRCTENSWKLNSLSFGSETQRHFSVKATEKVCVQEKLMNIGNAVSATGGKSEGQPIAFKRVYKKKEKPKSLIVQGSSNDRGNNAVSNISSGYVPTKSVNSIADVVKVPKPEKKLFKGREKEMSLVENKNSCHPVNRACKPKDKQKKMGGEKNNVKSGSCTPTTTVSSHNKQDTNSSLPDNVKSGLCSPTTTVSSHNKQDTDSAITVDVPLYPQKKAKAHTSSDKSRRSNVSVKKKSSGQTLKPLYPPVGKSVVVVESLTKANVMQKYLGDMYEVLPSNGHVRDLAGRSGSVRPDDDFSVVWEVPKTAWTHLKSMEVALRDADNLILASDPDLEGEAIAWHITDMLQQQDALREGITVARVVFHEMTESSIKSALQSPRDIDADLVHAYHARRFLDYLIGFNISPLLWRKLPGCQSAGRVQSVALAIICEREKKIENFKPEEFWTINAEFNKKIPDSLDQTFPLSHLTHFDSEKLDTLAIKSQSQAKNIEDKIISSNFKVVGRRSSNSQKQPPAPYRTSTLQQDAANTLQFSILRTMMLAQKLYEGVKISDTETVGLITYMRTDGMHISDESVNDIRSLVVERYGFNFAAKSTHKSSEKVKNTQRAAHEAIRPTDIRKLPSMLSGVLDEDSLKLYTLIWCRTMACQMKPAVIDQIQIDFGVSRRSLLLQSTCSIINFLGYQAIYNDIDFANIEMNKKDAFSDEQSFKALFTLKVGTPVSLREVKLKQHSTQPSARFSEASFVEKLEELGIGRPSTYAATMKVLQDRKYMSVKAGVIHPEFRGRMVSAFLSHHFSEVMDTKYTAEMETELDNVSAGVREWKGLLNNYWTRFSEYSKHAEKVHVKEVEIMLEEYFGEFLFSSIPDKSRTCPSCSLGTLRFKASKFGVGYFIGCDQHPKCRYIAKTMYGEDDDGEEEMYVNDDLPEPKLLGLKPGSDEKVFLKKGPYGFYIQLDDDRKGHVPKRVSIADPPSEILSITLEQALEMLSYPKILGNHPDDGKPVVLNLSKLGFSVKHGRTNVWVPKTVEGRDLTLENGIKLLNGTTARRIGRPVDYSK